MAYVRKLAEDDSQPVPPVEAKDLKRPENHSPDKKDIESFLKWFARDGQNGESVEIGELLFNKRKSCLACHEIDEEGGHVGPGLSRAAFFYRPEWVYAWIKNPQAFRPDSRMPGLGLTDNEARSLFQNFKGAFPTPSSLKTAGRRRFYAGTFRQFF